MKAFILNLGFFSSAVCAVGTMLHGQPSATGHSWLCSTSPHGCAGTVVLLATWGWLCVLHGSLAASQQWQSSVEQCPVNTSFSTSTKLCMLSQWRILQSDFSSTWQLRLRPCCSIGWAVWAQKSWASCRTAPAVPVKSMSLRKPGWQWGYLTVMANNEMIQLPKISLSLGLARVG